MNNELKENIRKAVGELTLAEYDGKITAFLGCYITDTGDVNSIVCIEKHHILNGIGALEIVKDVLKNGLSTTYKGSKFDNG